MGVYIGPAPDGKIVYIEFRKKFLECLKCEYGGDPLTSKCQLYGKYDIIDCVNAKKAVGGLSIVGDNQGALSLTEIQNGALSL